MNLTAWLIIFVLIAFTSLYVAAEFAAVGVRRSQISQLAQEGNALARGLLPFLEDAERLDRYIAACQIGITLSSLILGAFGQAAFADDLAALLRQWFGLATVTAQSTAAALILIGMTTLHVVLGELVPKSLALQFPTALALYTYLPMRWSLVVYSGFIAFLNGSGILILKLLGVPSGGHRHIHSPEEIEMLIAESHDGGLLEPEEQRRLHRALHLSRRTARQLMVPRRQVQAIEVTTPPDQLLRVAMESPFTRLPVYRETIDNVVGLLHTKDLAARYAHKGGISSIQEVLRPIHSVPGSVMADRLLTTLRERRSRLVVVLDEFGGTAGIVTLEDVVTELLGDVADEFKSSEQGPERLEDGRVRLPGLLRVDEAESWINATWSNELAETVGGYVMAALGRVPASGECFTFEEVEVEVEKVEGQAIVSLLARPKVVVEARSEDA